MSDWNTQIIEQFRANGGEVDGPFEGAGLILLHHVGRKSGTEYVTPLVYFTEESLTGSGDSSTRYIAASMAGAPTHPQWYANITAAGSARVETGAETVELRVEDLQGSTRDEVWGRITASAPGFAGYDEKTRGIRTIPVLALHP